MHVKDSRATAKAVLLTKIQQDRQLLLNWIKLPTDNAYFGGFLRIPNMTMAFWVYSLKTLGGNGQISVKIQNVSMDVNQDGIVTEEEFDANEELQKDLVAQSLSLLGTLGVVGALIFSVLYSTVLLPLVASNESSTYFSPIMITTLSYLYYITIYFALARSFTTIYQSVILYLKLSVWMPTMEMKMWFITRRSLTPVVNNGLACLVSASVAIPFAIAVAVSPGAALIAIIMEVITVLGFLYEFLDNFDCCIKLHQRATEILTLKSANNDEKLDHLLSNPMQMETKGSHIYT